MAEPKPLRNMVHAWIDAATTDELRELAEALGSSPATLYQLSLGHRAASPARALELEVVTAAMRKTNRALPALVCGDASEVCRRCPHFVKSVGKHRALAAEFGPSRLEKAR
jgi:hypothetical protein